MGIYISDLEIPKDKAVQIVIIRDDGVCVDEWGNTYGVVSLPPHGDLIDKDALMDGWWHLRDAVKYGNKSAEQQSHSYSTMMMYEIADEIDNAPTIIDAEPCNDLAKPNNDAEEGE